jgi:predicted nucleic acid-binding protein
VLVDTNVLVRHLTGEPAEQATRATALLRRAPRLQVRPLVVAELVYVLESVYRQRPARVATLVRAVLTHPPMEVPEREQVLRALELYETHRLDFAEAYLAAWAEHGDTAVVSFDRDLDRAPGVTRVEP